MSMEPPGASDSNNNQPGLGLGPIPAGMVAGVAALDKYSLRPRSLKKRAETELRRQQHHLAAALQGGVAGPPVGRVATPAGYAPHAPHGATQGATHATRPSRPKQKPAPLSKYRRKTANARERSRMREINVAFETLRRAVPHSSAPACASEKLTKITTLRLAMKYIAALTQAVREAQDSDGADGADAASCSPLGLVDDVSAYAPPLFGAPDSPCALLPGMGLPLPTFDQFRGGSGSASSSSSPSAGQGLADDFADHSSLLSADFADFPEPSLGMGGMAGIADLVDPCLTAVALTSDDFYDTAFMTDFG